MRRLPPPRLEALEDRTLFAASLVAAYGFNEAAGPSVTDASGSGNTGTISGAAWTTAGKFGGALSFDGSSNWVTVADSPSLHLTTGLTLEAWVRPSTLSGWRTVFTKETGGGEVFQLYASNGAAPAAYLSTTTGGDQGTAASNAIPANAWTHLASTFDGSVLRLYVNGALAASQNVAGTILTSSSPLRIGGNAPWGEYFSGVLDELRVFNGARTAAEIVQDMNTAVSGGTPADTTPPTVPTVSPAAGATNVAASARVTATFSEAIDPATLTASTFSLKTAAGASVAASVSYDASTLTATLTPSAALTASTTYTATVKGGSVKDLAGNPLAADRVWTFSTAAVADTTPPTVTAVSPASGATNVAASARVTATFSEAINASTLSATTFTLQTAAGASVAASVSYDPATLTATLTPNAAMGASTSYTATVKGGAGGVKDLAGNALAADRVWTFSTAAATGGFQQTTAFSGLTNPTVVRFAPDGRAFVAEKSGVIKVFDNLSDTTASVFADLNASVFNAWDRGLLGMALSPDFATNPYVYVLYTLDAHTDRNAPVWGTPGVYGDPLPTPPGATNNGVVVSGRLSRLRVQSNGTAGAEEILIDKQWLQQFPSHSLGSLQFGPDGMLYASAGDGASFSYVDYGQTAVNVDPRNPASMGDPLNEGGALRSQDLRSSGDPVTLDGAILRVNPATGAAPADNPLAANADANAKRIIAEGLRNPFRFTFRPGTSEIWAGDVGWNNWEEINRIVSPTDATVENFGWPAYEGTGPQTGYQSANLSLLQPLYATPSLVTTPYYTYAHSAQVVSGSGEPTGGSSISGLAFYTGTSYPSQYRGALFFSDYSRNWIWAMMPGTNGLPDPNNRVTFVANAAGPVHLEIGPNGDLFYAGFNDGTIRRVQFVSSNRAPAAVALASPSAGQPPLTVQFDGSTSSDPDAGTTLSYAWDLDGDGQFDDSTAAKPTWTYSTAGTYTASLRVSDGQLSSVGTVTIRVGNTAPTAVIDAPLSTLTWQVGQTITFAGHASDPEQGTLPASALTWSLILHHNTHTHPLQTYVGVSGGSFVTPDHDYPSYLELTLTATDSGGLSSTTSVRLDPKTVNLTVQSSPAGLSVGLNSETVTTPFTRTVILGSNNSVSAPPTQTFGGNGYQFVSWSDGGAATHNVTAAASATFTANYAFVPAAIGSEGFRYRAETAPYQAIDLVPGAAGVFTVRSSGDNQTSTLNLASGSTFNFYGTSYTRLYVSTNGLITFGSANSSAANTDLTSAPSQRAIAVLWDDWVNTNGNAMILGKYEDVNGDGVSDRLILEWNKVQGAATSPSPVTFQAILSLNTGATAGDVVLNYPDLDAGNARSNGGSATVGIKDVGTQGARRLLVSFDAAGAYVGSGKAVRFRYAPAGAAAQSLAADAGVVSALSTKSVLVSSPAAPVTQTTAAPSSATPSTQTYVGGPGVAEKPPGGSGNGKTPQGTLFVSGPALPGDEPIVTYFA